MAQTTDTTERLQQKPEKHSNWRQFWLLLWKNWLLQKKKVVLTVLLVLLPIVMALVLLAMRNNSDPRVISNATTYDSFVVSPTLSEVDGRFRGRVSLAYAPNTNLVTRIMNRSATIMGVKIPPDLGFESEKALEDHMTTDQNVFGAIVFLLPNDAVGLPKKIVYKIRMRSDASASLFGARRLQWKTNAMFSEENNVGPREQHEPEAHFGGVVPGYYYEGFLAIQWAVDLSLVAEVNSSFDLTTPVTTQLKRYPFPPYNADTLILVFKVVFPLFILLGFIIIAPTICQEIVLEKENKFKESMKLMGMRTWLYWCSWLVKYLLLVLPSVVVMTVLFHAPISSKGPVFGHSSASVTFVFLILYCLALITFCFAISTLVSKASYGSAAGGILYILAYVPYFYLGTIYDDMTFVQKVGASVDFSLAMGFGCIKIYQFERLGIGAQWSNVWSSTNARDGHTMGHVLIMLFVDVIIYSILTWYLDAVMPSDFGTPQPFYFPFTRQYWAGTNRSQEKSPGDDFMTLVPEVKRQYFENPMQNAKAGIQIRGLTKQFGPKVKPAVLNLNIDMYEGNITALLGHNGAGKTTTMFMLTGFLPPSKGTAFINGFDITRDMDRIRQNLGLCPQHDVLFDTLTVREHLLFFAMLKGCPVNKAELEVTEMIKVLHMEEKVNAPAKTLSGGQRRKLSVGIALISGSRFVILDEPTSGMDPEARRQTWDILQSQRKDRTMILSTHYMDEADLLGDRIAIMSSGQIQCYGTPMFLKNKFGVGYHLTIVKKPNCDVSQLRVVVKSQIPTAHMESNEAAEATFVLPSQQSAQFEKLFETLETDREILGVDSFGVSVTTMEEVFLRVKDSSTIESRPRTSIVDSPEITDITPPVDVTYRKETGWKRLEYQLVALVYKRFIHSIRNRIITLGQILIPVIFTILACFVLKERPSSDEFPSLTLDLTHFTGPIIPYDVRPLTASAQGLASCYEASVSKQGKVVSINSKPGYSTMDAYLVGIGKDHADQYNWNYQIGATIEEEPDGKLKITGFFNNEAYHAIAISLSYLGNTLMRCYGNSEYRIETVNHPLPKNSTDHVKDNVDEENGRGFGFSYCVSFGMAFLFGTFLVFLVKERTSGAKHSQLVSGVELQNFWLATFLWDFCNYLVPCVLIVIIILAFRTEGYWQHSWIIFLDLILYGWAMLSFTYIISFLFDESSVGFVWLSVINIITGTFATVIIFVMQALVLPSTWKTVELIFYIIFPNYCFNAALQNIYKNYNNHKICNDMAENVNLAEFCATLKRLGQPNPCCKGDCGISCVEMVDNYLSWELPGVCRPLVFMFLQGVVFFLLIYIIEADAVGSLLKFMTPNRVSQAMLNELDADEGGTGKTNADSDVLSERQRIQSTPIQELVQKNPVVVKDLTKLFGNFVAVNQLNLGVSESECFGLLGVNGAGKTTTFKMLTGEIRPTFGNAYIAGVGVQGDLAQVRQRIGYCAQYDSVIDQLTVQETLWMYACARGIPGQVREQVIERLIDHLTLKPFTEKLAGTLSGGNKRKLCVAVALMGNPKVVFLDEPTTGVDPEARRHVWNTLVATRNAGSTIILTSHSMEECESICTRLAVLVNGRFLCLGSLQHLKDKFSEGYTLIVKLQRSSATEELQARIENLKTFVSLAFPGSILKDHHENLLTYQVNTRNFKWSQIFGIMEKAKVTYQIEDYSVGQTTLEQLFISFARLQRGPRDISSRKKFLGLF